MEKTALRYVILPSRKSQLLKIYFSTLLGTCSNHMLFPGIQIPRLQTQGLPGPHSFQLSPCSTGSSTCCVPACADQGGQGSRTMPPPQPHIVPGWGLVLRGEGSHLEDAASRAWGGGRCLERKVGRRRPQMRAGGGWGEGSQGRSP